MSAATEKPCSAGKLGAAAVWLLLPAGLKVRPVDGATWRAILTNPGLLSVVAVTGLLAAAGFALFADLVPAVKQFVGASPALVAVLLAAFGTMGLLGNMLAARFMDRLGADNIVLCCLLAMLAGHLLWPWSEQALAVLTVALLAWGSGIFAGNSAQQARLAALAPAHAPVLIALNSSAIYLGQAVGTAAAGALIAHTPGAAAYASLARLSVPLVLVAIGLSLLASLRGRSTAVSWREP